MSRLTPEMRAAVDQLAKQQQEQAIWLAVKNLETAYAHRYALSSAKLHQYTKLVMFAGYAGFFALLSLLKDITPLWSLYIAGILIIISLLSFILNEVYNMFVGAYLGNSVETIYFRLFDLLRSGEKGQPLYDQAIKIVYGENADPTGSNFQTTDEQESIFELLKSRPVWRICFPLSVITGFSSGFVLIGGWIQGLWQYAF